MRERGLHTTSRLSDREDGHHMVRRLNGGVGGRQVGTAPRLDYEVARLARIFVEAGTTLTARPMRHQTMNSRVS